LNCDTDPELLERGINLNSSTNNEQVNRGSDSIEDTGRGHCEEETGTISYIAFVDIYLMYFYLKFLALLLLLKPLNCSDLHYWTYYPYLLDYFQDL
jgi:hypothetical protein